MRSIDPAPTSMVYVGQRVSEPRDHRALSPLIIALIGVGLR